jgi:N-acetylneuraminic acid mutarotase
VIRALLRVALVATLLATACSSDAEPELKRPTGPPPKWSAGAELGTPRTELAVAALDGKVYAAGGFLKNGSPTDLVEVYDPGADRWSTSVALPVPLHHTGLAAARGRLYVIGGYTKDGASSAGVWSWAPGEREWSSEDALPTPRGALGVATLEVADTVSIHAVGGATAFGTGGARLSGAHEIFNLERKRWTKGPPLPGPRDHLAATSLEGRVYAVGGRELSLARNKVRVDVFDSLEGRWSRVPDMPTPRGGLAAVGTSGRVFAFGGEQPSGTFDAAEVYDLAGDHWVGAPAMPTARHGLGAAVVGDRIYVVGGGPKPGLTVSAANEILVIES